MTTIETDEGMNLLSRTARVYGLSAVLAGAAAVVYVIGVAPLQALPAPFEIPWPVVLLSFAAAEVFVVHLHLRRQAHSFSLSEVPLIIGLVFAGPVTLIATRILGAFSALVLHRRQAPVKLAFNAAHLALETCLAVAIFRTVLGSASPVSWRGTLAAFAVTITTDLLAAAYVSVAIALHDGRFERYLMREALTQGVVIAAVNTSLALLAITVLWYSVATSWVLVVIAALAVLAYRSHHGLSRGFARLEALYTFTRDVSAENTDLARRVLERCRELLRADAAELVFLFPDAPPHYLTLDSVNERSTAREGQLYGPWAATASEGQPVALPRGHGIAGAPRMLSPRRSWSATAR